jgi:transposase
MHRFIDGEDRMQPALLPHSLEDYVSEENPVRVIEVFIDELDPAALGFSGMTPAATSRQAYHPSTLLEIYLYGYLNHLQSRPAARARSATQYRVDVVGRAARP